jgi:hypothetical protein
LRETWLGDDVRIRVSKHKSRQQILWGTGVGTGTEATTAII